MQTVILTTATGHRLAERGDLRGSRGGGFDRPGDSLTRRGLAST